MLANNQKRVRAASDGTTGSSCVCCNIAPGTAMLHITRVSYLESGAAVELTHSFCRSDYYEFVAESRR